MSHVRTLELLHVLERAGLEGPAARAVDELLQLLQHDPLNDLNPDRLHPPTPWLREQTVYDVGGCVYYEPFVKGGCVGYVCRTIEEGNQRETYLYFNPSESDDEDPPLPNVFIYKGGENDPAQDQSQCYIALDELRPTPAQLAAR